jgi:uncharacterized protein (TIGR03437 family)
LKSVAVPAPSNLATYVRDPAVLVVLGKALFWDAQVGSDGKIACASCHFHAGADHRQVNQLFNPLANWTGTNAALRASDFPFHQLADPRNRSSQVLRDSQQRAGSSGMFSRKLNSLTLGLANEDAVELRDATFRLGGLNMRNVGNRNAPSVVNAVFNFRNFWDGRASDTFTGLTPFGLSDKRANILSAANGALQAAELRLERSALASQAVGPVLSGAEMSYASRTWPRVGKRMLPLRPLANQRIAPDDSVLGRFTQTGGPGFVRGTTYLDLVKAAFQPAYWSSTQLVNESGAAIPAGSTLAEADRFTQAEYNFAMFFGLAVQAYEATLIANDTPVDRFADGQTNALSNAELAGMQLFIGRTGCNACHSGAELTLAAHTGVQGNDPLKAGRDTGFFQIGVRPASDDIGLGGSDGFGSALASTLPTDTSPASSRGRFKTPSLRNVEFTGPYFHNGGQATLEQVIQFYNRGGDFDVNSTSGPNIRNLELGAADQANMVAFLKALSDDRVRFERAPFDHPELCVPDGHVPLPAGLAPYPSPIFTQSAADRWVGLPATGANGNRVPLQTFEELLAGIGSDGSRAHHMNAPCEIKAFTAADALTVNAASFQSSVISAESIASAFAVGLTRGTATAQTNPPPASLAGVTVSVEDSKGVTRAAPIFFVSPQQVNYLVPEGIAPGAANVTITSAEGTFLSPVIVRPVAPGLFGVNGLAAANVLAVRGSEQIVSNTIRVNAAGQVELDPIEVGREDQITYLILYGTGIRGHANPVAGRIGTVDVATMYAGPQGTYAGQDQINIVLPRGLQGAGVVDVTLTVDGQSTNSVKLRFQ